MSEINKFESDRETDRSKWWNRLELDDRFYSPDIQIIDWFFDDYRYLSNYHIQPIVYNGKSYMTTEHAYQACKATLEEAHENIRLASSPGKAKKLGGLVKLRPDWEDVKEQIMREVVWLKFITDATLTRKLLNTGNAYLIEGTVWHDNTWGICVKKDCKKCSEKRGKNLLGKILMETREELRKAIEEVNENIRRGIDNIG
jgi:ribA/ribD-fused uncharacterized protein